MIKFRQKDFSGSGKELYKRVKESPGTKAIIVATPTAIGVANLSLNMSRKKKDTELREEQVEAMRLLAESIRESSNNKEIKKGARKIETSFRKKHPESIEDEDIIVLPNPVSMLKKKSKNEK